MGCASEAVVPVLATILHGCSEVVVANISVGLDHDLVPLSNGEIKPISRVRLDGDEVVGDDREVVVV